MAQGPRQILMAAFCARQATCSHSSISPAASLYRVIRTSSVLPLILKSNFSQSAALGNWLAPKKGETKKSPKGRPRVATGGSVRGTTIVWGDYGIRLLQHGRRISALQLKVAEDTIRMRLRGITYRLFKRVSANIGVCTKGNEVRMGKGKGSFDYWAVRLPVSRIAFELTGDMHEKVARDALRLAGNKLPGLWEFVRRGDPPVMGITPLKNGVTEEFLRRPRRAVPLPSPTAVAQAP